MTNPPAEPYSKPTAPVGATDPRVPVVVFGIGIAAFVLYFLVVAIHFQTGSDFKPEAWAPYQMLFRGHVIGFIQTSPAYVGSLVLRAPFALIASVFGAGVTGTYDATALPCIVAPAVLAGWLFERRPKTAAGRPRRVSPLDLFMLTPPAIICITLGHPEDILGAVLCVAAVLVAQRGSARTAGAILAVALINKSWAVVAAPLVIALMPPGRRLAGITTGVVLTAVVMVPLLAIRTTGASGAVGALGGGVGQIFLVPQLLWFFGAHSWIVREAHILLVLVCWLTTAIWWWFRARDPNRQPSTGTTLMILALVFFLRAVLDPWDNGYYFVPFMLTIVVYEDLRGGFPRLTWAFVVMLLIFVPAAGLLHSLGNNGHAATFAVWALATIAFFGWRSFTRGAPSSADVRQATPTGVSA